MSIAGDQDTIKASASLTRSKTSLSAAFEPPSDTPSRSSTPTPAGDRAAAVKAKAKAKHFSWQPLTFDAFDDTDWSSWDSPSATSVKSSRWSGSTVGAGEGIASIPERADEMDTPL